MTGSKYGTHFPGFLADNLKDPTDVGSVFAAISIDSFMDLPEFQEAMDTAIREVKNCARAEGVERIYVPGEIEMGIRADRLANGIPLPEAVLTDFCRPGHGNGSRFPRGIELTVPVYTRAFRGPLFYRQLKKT